LAGEAREREKALARAPEPAFGAFAPNAGQAVEPAFPQAPLPYYRPSVEAGAAPKREPAEGKRRSARSGRLIGNRPLEEIRADFPILSEKAEGGSALAWLDNAATTQKPACVYERLQHYYMHENSNVHRGAHELARRSTDAYEGARETVARFIGAPSSGEIVFARGTTEAINLVAQSFVKPRLKPGDEIVLTILEHHANIVPWQMIAQETGAVLRVAPVGEDGQILLGEYSRLFGEKTKFVSAAHVSNALGTVAPVAELVGIAHSHGVPILIDGAQSAPHAAINVASLDCDFFAFSGHKIYGPTGIGALYGKAQWLEEARPYQGGGNMIEDVSFEKTVYRQAPAKFEAGTGSIADAAGLAAALDYVSGIGVEAIASYESWLLAYATDALRAIPSLRLVGTARQKASVLSFVLGGHSVEEVGRRLSEEGIAVRAGHHCAQPIHRRFGLEGTVRPSIAFYNTAEEIDRLCSAIRRMA
jgi:cysteine desulfurase/selenocysteine lyase